MYVSGIVPAWWENWFLNCANHVYIATDWRLLSDEAFGYLNIFFW